MIGASCAVLNRDQLVKSHLQKYKDIVFKEFFRLFFLGGTAINWGKKHKSYPKVPQQNQVMLVSYLIHIRALAPPIVNMKNSWSTLSCPGALQEIVTRIKS